MHKFGYRSTTSSSSVSSTTVQCEFLPVYNLVFYKKYCFFFSAGAEYSYFSADFRRKIFLVYSVDDIPFFECLGVWMWFGACLQGLKPHITSITSCRNVISIELTDSVVFAFSIVLASFQKGGI